jgi:S-adenosyl-L-methionine hydrolase (adenosine-forming)
MIGLLSDFGYTDSYAGIMKAVILGINPQAVIIDICHGISPRNILSGAYELFTAIDYMPANSVISCVVDPGVGSDRDILIAKCYNAAHASITIVVPDNGLITLVAKRYPQTEIYKVSPKDLAQISQKSPTKKNSQTFHGRDVFAPLVALLDTGDFNINEKKLVTDYTQLLAVESHNLSQLNGLRGYIMHIDHFGNAICSIHLDDTKPYIHSTDHDWQHVRISFSGLILQGIHKTYSDMPVGTELCYWGSSNFLEIAVNMDSAAKNLEINQGDELELHFNPYLQ